MVSTLVAMLLVFGVFVTPLSAQEAAEPSPAESQGSTEEDETAHLYYDRGQAAYTAGDFEEARQWFRRSYAVSGRAALLFNIGQAAERAGDSDGAIAAFERFLQLEPGSPKAPEVRRNLELLTGNRPGNVSTTPAPTSAETSSPQAPDSSPSGAADPLAPTEISESPRDGAVPAPLEEEESTVFESPWFWIVAAVLVGGGVAAALLLTSDQEELPPGTWGNTTALRWSL